jgi:hypothetical protein
MSGAQRAMPPTAAAQGRGAGQGPAFQEPRTTWLGDWTAAWNAFWFTPADPLPLAVIRICTGLLLVWSSLVWLRDADAFFGADGWMAADEVWRMNDQPWQWSWYFAAPTPAVVRGLAVVAPVAAILLTVGLATPIAAVVSLVAFISAANRAPLNVFGLDDTLGLLLVGLVVGPAGDRLALDGPVRGRGRGAASIRANIALRLIQIHLCVVYFFSGCGKMLGASWWEGTALWGAAANVQYRTLDLTWLARHPHVTNALTLATLFWEATYPALVWPRLTRRLVLAMAVVVHLGIGLAMGMMEFGLAMITANLAFLPATTLGAWLRPFVPPAASSRFSHASEGLS